MLCSCTGRPEVARQRYLGDPFTLGYLGSEGQVQLFTDADSFFYDKFAIAKAISLMHQKQIQVLTGTPLIELKDLYSKIAMPLFNLFSVFRALNYALKGDNGKVNHLIGGFFVIDKNVLDKIGGFISVKTSMQEDTDLGKRIKDAGYLIELIRVNKLLSAFWSRDRITLIDGIKRIIAYNLRTDSKYNIVVDITTIVGMVILPYILLTVRPWIYTGTHASYFILGTFSWNLILCLIPIVGVALKGMTKYRLDPIYSESILFKAAFLLTVHLVNLSYLNLSFRSSTSLKWKDRKVSVR